jgi:energy-converting hydrogenase A subunit M
MFSKKEEKFLKQYFYLLEVATEDTPKINKSKLYRETFGNPEIKTAVAVACVANIFKKFNSLSEERKEELKTAWLNDVESQILHQRMEEMNFRQAVIVGKEDAYRKLSLGFYEGVKLGQDQLKRFASNLSLKTEEEHTIFLEAIASLCLSSYKIHSQPENCNITIMNSAMSNLIEIAKLNLARFKDSEERIKKMIAFKKQLEEQF